MYKVCVYIQHSFSLSFAGTEIRPYYPQQYVRVVIVSGSPAALIISIPFIIRHPVRVSPFSVSGQ